MDKIELLGIPLKFGAANNGWQGLRVSAEDMIAKAKESAQ